jgi:hypothetical protein
MFQATSRRHDFEIEDFASQEPKIVFAFERPPLNLNHVEGEGPANNSARVHHHQQERQGVASIKGGITRLFFRPQSSRLTPWVPRVGPETEHRGSVRVSGVRD